MLTQLTQGECENIGSLSDKAIFVNAAFQMQSAYRFGGGLYYKPMIMRDENIFIVCNDAKSFEIYSAGGLIRAEQCKNAVEMMRLLSGNNYSLFGEKETVEAVMSFESGIKCVKNVITAELFEISEKIEIKITDKINTEDLYELLASAEAFKNNLPEYDEFYVNIYHVKMANGGFALGQYKDGKLVSAGLVNAISEKYALINAVIAKKEYRNCGVGTKMLDALIREAVVRERIPVVRFEEELTPFYKSRINKYISCLLYRKMS